MNRFSNALYKFAFYFMQYCSVFVAVLLFVCGFFITGYADDMVSQKSLIRVDNLLVNVAGMVFLTALMYVIGRFVMARPEKRKNGLLTLVLFWYCLIGLVLVVFGRTVPAADAMSVYSAAAELAAGNTEVISAADSYLSYYPQQIGLVGYYEILIRIWNLLPIDQHAYHMIKCINILWACISVVFQYKTVQMLFKNDMADTVYLLLSLIHFPLLLYTSFVYGEIPSYALFAVGVWAFFKLLEYTGGRRQKGCLAVLSLVCFGGSVALRKNTLILMIAVILVGLLEALRRRNQKLLVYTLLVICATCLTLPAIQSYYENRTGSALKSGVTAFSYFAMGMQEASRGAGWYNGFNFETYQAAGMDTEAANEISKAAIAERLEYFRENPDYALSFYSRKFMSQWCDGSYASRQATLATFGGRHSILQSLYEGSYSKYFIEFCNLLQNQIYIGVLWFMISACRKRQMSARHSTVGDCGVTGMQSGVRIDGLPVYLFFIAVVGGLLFHMLWEANSRYIFTYGLLLLPYAAAGIGNLAQRAAVLQRKFVALRNGD